MTLHRPLHGPISRFFRRNGTKVVLLRILLSHRNFLFLFSFSSNVLKLRNRDNEPKRSRLKPVNEKDENQDQGTSELDICYYRFIDGTSFVVFVVFLFLFSLRPSGSHALTFSFWHSLEDQLFFPTRSLYCEIAFSSLQPLITKYYPALTKIGLCGV